MKESFGLLRMVNILLLLSMLVVIVSCNRKPPTPRVPMELFPQQIGGFKIKGSPELSSGDNFSAIYKNDKGEEAKYGFNNYPIKNAPDVNTLFNAEGVRIYYDVQRDSLNLVLKAGNKGVEVVVNSVEAVNEWANNFPYAAVGALPPPMPVKVLLPPPSFFEARGKTDPEIFEAARQTSLATVKLWFIVKSIDCNPKISKVDPSTLDAGNPKYVEQSLADQLGRQFVKEHGKTFRGFGFRQIVVQGIAHPF